MIKNDNKINGVKETMAFLLEKSKVYISNNEEKKTCFKCNKLKNINQFHRNKNIKSNLDSYCKTCWKKYRNTTSSKLYQKQYYEKNKDILNKKKEEYYQNNIEKIKEYINNNKERRSEYEKQKRKKDPKFRLRQVISSAINRKLKKRNILKEESIIKYLPYTIIELKQHLESQFESWMNWENYGNSSGKWTIDHIYPESRFSYLTPYDEEFKKCWALENLRPLEFIENCKKSDKM